MKQKTLNLSADARTQIAETLPMALEKAITSYQNFVDDRSSEDHADYKNKQTAAKAGLAHIELLMKLANMVDALSEDQSKDLASLLQGAKTELEGGHE